VTGPTGLISTVAHPSSRPSGPHIAEPLHGHINSGPFRVSPLRSAPLVA